MSKDWVTVAPAPGDVRAVARELLKLARTPQDVRTTAGGTEFRVPPYLADLYNTPAPVAEPAEAPKPRRRTRKDGDE